MYFKIKGNTTLKKLFVAHCERQSLKLDRYGPSHPAVTTTLGTPSASLGRQEGPTSQPMPLEGKARLPWKKGASEMLDQTYSVYLGTSIVGPGPFPAPRLTDLYRTPIMSFTNSR